MFRKVSGFVLACAIIATAFILTTGKPATANEILGYIRGTAYEDLNANGKREVNEPVMANAFYKITNGGAWYVCGYVGYEGTYGVPVTPGTYFVLPIAMPGYRTTTPRVKVTIDFNGQASLYNDIGFVKDPSAPLETCDQMNPVRQYQVLLILPEQSADMEYMLTQEVGVMVSMLKTAGLKVVTASASGQPLVGSATTLKPDLKLADVKVDDYAGFMLPCLAVDLTIPRSPEAIEIVKKAVALRKPVAAQLGGVLVLSDAGVLNGKQYTWIEEWPLSKGIYKGIGVVQDGYIITSGACPFMAKMFGLKDGTPELTEKFIAALASQR